LSYSEPAPHNFSFNSPQGACPKCKGLGQVNLLDMPDEFPIQAFKDNPLDQCSQQTPIAIVRKVS